MNKIVRLCVSKYTDEIGSLNYKIEGALFIVQKINSSRAFGYHLKKQGGNTIGEYNLLIKADPLDGNYEKIEVVLEDIFDANCNCGSGFLLKNCCLNFEWITECYDLDSSDYISAFENKTEYEDISHEILQMRLKYMIAGGDDHIENTSINIDLFRPRVFDQNFKEFGDLFWLELDEFSEQEFILKKIDIECVSEIVPGNMAFLY